MINTTLGRPVGRFVLTLAALGALGIGVALAESSRGAKAGRTPAPRPAPVEDEPQLKTVVLPVNTNDPIAKINGEVITRQQLADECVARKGEEILETMIARKLIEQAIRAKNLTITAGEIDEEIERVAKTMAGISREAWLRTLHKERGISPVQYARDIIYPALALRKLALPRIVVTPDDYKQAFASAFGEKLRCRMILVSKAQHGKEIWEELRQNPDRFEKIARDDPRSIDQGTRSLGGLMAEPIRRFAQPRTVSDAVFRDLVDGDRKETDQAHKPKDGDISGVIEVTKDSWVIMRRESLESGEKRDPNNPMLKMQLLDAIREAKLKDEMAKVYDELTRAAAIENRLVGRSQEANEEQETRNLVDGQVKLSSDPGAALPPKPNGTRASAGQVAHPPTPNFAPSKGK